MQTADEPVQSRFQRALDTVVSKLKQDPYVLAVILMGSMSHDVVWEKSDIDLLVVTQEVKARSRAMCLTEDGVNIHAYIYTRSEFKRALEGSPGSSFTHSLLSKGTPIYSVDPTIIELYEGRYHFGSRDRQVIALSFATTMLPTLDKAEKWLTVKHDREYCLMYILMCAQGLAGVEAVLHGEITGREVIHQALRLNPEFFNTIYTDLLSGNASEDTLAAALNAMRTYLLDRLHIIFDPLLDYLAEAGTTRSTTEISDYFKNHMRLECIETACEWLANEEIIIKVSAPARVTEKSRVSVEEAAYYYDPN